MTKRISGIRQVEAGFGCVIGAVGMWRCAATHWCMCGHLAHGSRHEGCPCRFELTREVLAERFHQGAAVLFAAALQVHINALAALQLKSAPEISWRLFHPRWHRKRRSWLHWSRCCAPHTFPSGSRWFQWDGRMTHLQLSCHSGKLRSSTRCP